MLILLSPSKTLDFETPVTAPHTLPDFLPETEALIGVLQKLSPKKISNLMDLSEPLTQLNVARYQTFSTPFTPANAKPAGYAFKGDVYDGLAFETLTPKEIQRAEVQLRMISGLYGLLRPLDLIQPYRLEMGTKLKTRKGKNLYEFWGDKITKKINAELAAQQTPLLCNLASNEYYKAIKPKLLHAEVVTPVFKENKNGQAKIVMLFAKRARGMMARYILQNGIADVEGLKSFSEGGYRYQPELSEGRELVFVR